VKLHKYLQKKKKDRQAQEYNILKLIIKLFCIRVNYISAMKKAAGEFHTYVHQKQTHPCSYNQLLYDICKIFKWGTTESM